MIPAVLWWRDSVLFVILLSLATQISTEIGSAHAANDQVVTERLRHVEAQLDALLEQTKAGARWRTSPATPSRSASTLLAGAHRDREILSVCPDGHLVVKGRTHWAPLRFATDRPSLICGFVEHPEPADA